MSDTFWMAFFSGLPQILFGTVLLIMAFRGQADMKHLSTMVDGRFSDILKLLSEAMDVRGDVKSIKEKLPPTTTVVTERRKAE
jgi:hypothetical protein